MSDKLNDLSESDQNIIRDILKHVQNVDMVKLFEAGKLDELSVKGIDYLTHIKTIKLVSGKKIWISQKTINEIKAMCEDFHKPGCVYFSEHETSCMVKGCPVLFINTKKIDVLSSENTELE
jgi:hypothetical protein